MESKKIKVVFIREKENEEDNEDKRFLEFQFVEPYRLELTENDQVKVKELFSIIVSNYLKEDFEFVICRDENSDSDVMYEASEEYVKDLNAELIIIKKDASFVRIREKYNSDIK